MTPQLQQAIKLLQLNNLEVAAFVEEQLEENPLLERQEGDADSTPSAQAEAEEPAGTQEGSDYESVSDAGGATDLDTDYENLWDSDAVGGGELMQWGRGSGGFDNAAFGVDQTVARKITLRDHLQNQLNIDIADPVDRLIGLHLIEMLDEAGYLSGELADVAAVLGCEMTRVEATLERLQRFDPAGIFARNLAECLMLQLRDRNRLDPAMQALLDNLNLLAERKLDALRQVCGIDGEDLEEMIAEIRALDPKPADSYAHEPVQPVTPDLLMRPTPTGAWHIELNSETLPRVLINGQYYAQVRSGARGKSEKDYIAEQYSAASWLVKSLHQRATTILRVATEIVRQQERFFARGVQHLKPLTLRDIAGEIEMHESTVSRVTSNKYIATPRGLYELKYFFTSAIASTDGGASHSAESVRHRIKALINTEKPQAILSDDKIVAMLRSDGIDIARRTVAKYREALRIPSSVQRRREKMIGL
jgi:RNA polymerase sigma-54 factor